VTSVRTLRHILFSWFRRNSLAFIRPYASFASIFIGVFVNFFLFSTRLHNAVEFATTFIERTGGLDTTPSTSTNPESIQSVRWVMNITEL